MFSFPPCEDYVRLSQFYCATTFVNAHDVNRSALLKHTIRQIEKINYAIPEGSPVESYKPEYVGYTALHFAVLESCEESCESVKLLLERGADPTLISRDGYSPIRLAAETSWKSQRRCLDLEGQLKHPVLEILLSAQVKAENAANVSCKNGVTHFHLACMLDHDVAVKFFLQVSGVSVNQAVNQDSPVLPGYTPMHFAVRYGSFRVARVLIDSGADLTIGDIDGITPLQLLVERNLELADVISIKEECAEFEGQLMANEEILDLFREKLRLINTDLGIPELHALCARKTTDRETILRLVDRDFHAAIDIRSPVRPGYTALHIAAHFNIETVMLLLERGLDVAAKDVRGVTPLDICVSHFKSEDVQRIIESVESLRDISFTDGTALLDVVRMISDPTLIAGMDGFRHQVTSDSPLWAGYTMLHLAVEFARRMDSADDIKKKFDHYAPTRLTVKGRVDESSIQVVGACSKFIDISTQNASGMTALHLAFRQRKRALVTLLMDEIQIKGMETNPTDFGNLSHLHIMCAEGRTSTIQAYLESCNGQVNLNDAVETGFQWYTIFPEPSYARSGSTALHIAVVFQRVDLLRLLLQHGADPLARDADGLNPLQLAFVIGSLNGPMRNFFVTELRSRNVNLVSNEGLSFFHVACYSNDSLLAEELLRNGLADIEASIKCGLHDTYRDRPQAIKTSEYYTSQYDCSDHFLPLAPFSGYRALHMAVQGKSPDTVELLLKHGADTQARSTAGLSPLQLALRNVHRDRHAEEVVIRLLKKADVEYDGLTKLHVACLLKDAAAIEEAIGAGVDIDARLALESPIWPGSTALHLLLEGKIDSNKLEPMLEQLLRRGANVNTPNFEGLTPIHSAYYKSCRSAVKLMLRSSRILENNPVDDEGLSHFHIACALGEESLVKEFLVSGVADPNCPKDFFTIDSDAGYTPLHFTMIRGNCATVKTLLRYGASVSAVDREGSTILHKIAGSWVFSEEYSLGENTVLSYIASNANLNAINIFGMTPLELCFKNNLTYLLPILLKHGARINIVNPISNKGLLSNACDSNLNFILENAKDIADIDPDTGFNAIHNILSSHSLEYFSLANAIEKLMEKGCDLDQPDAKGRTPLHVAMKWKESSKTVRVLLDFGADINAVDDAENTPLGYCDCYNKTRGILLSHLSKLSHFGLYINTINKNLAGDLSTKYESVEALLRRHRGHNDPESSKDWDNVLEQLRQVIIFPDFSLADLLKESFIAMYPRLPRSKREAIESSLSFRKLCERFTTLAPLLRLQHRKAIARLSLIGPATVSLQLLVRRALRDFRRLPHLCTEMIMTFLTNEDVQSLINIRK